MTSVCQYDIHKQGIRPTRTGDPLRYTRSAVTWCDTNAISSKSTINPSDAEATLSKAQGRKDF